MKKKYMEFDRADVNRIFSKEIGRVYLSLGEVLASDPAPTLAKVAALQLHLQERAFMAMSAVNSRKPE